MLIQILLLINDTHMEMTKTRARVTVGHCYSAKRLFHKKPSVRPPQPISRRHKQNHSVINCYPATLYSQPAFVVFVEVFRTNPANSCLNRDATSGTSFASHTVCIKLHIVTSFC